MAKCKDKNKHITLHKESNNDWIWCDKITTQIYEQKAKTLTLKKFLQFRFKNYYFDVLLNMYNTITVLYVIYHSHNRETWTEGQWFSK